MDIPEDKRSHFTTGFAMAAVVSLLSGYIIGLAVAVLAGAGTGLYYRVTGKGTAEVSDFVITAAGAVTAVAMSAAVSWCFSVTMAT